MDLDGFVDRVRQDLAVAAGAAGPEAVTLTERLTAPLTSAFRLTLLEALSMAADEITRELAPGSVELRLRGGEPSFAVTAPAAEPPAPPPESAASPAPSMAPPEADDLSADAEGAIARINFRVPEALKVRIDEAAAAQARSVNAWLTQVVFTALRQPDKTTTNEQMAGGRTMRHVTGWVN